MNIKVWQILGLFVIGITLGIIITGISMETSETDKFEDKMLQLASKYDPAHEVYDNPKLIPSMNLITNTDDCNDLRDIYETNPEWSARWFLADKYVKLCMRI